MRGGAKPVELCPKTQENNRDISSSPGSDGSEPTVGGYQPWKKFFQEPVSREKRDHGGNFLTVPHNKGDGCSNRKCTCDPCKGTIYLSRADRVSVADHRCVYGSQVGGENNVSDNRIFWSIQNGKVSMSIVFPSVYKYQLVTQADRQQAIASTTYVYTYLSVARNNIWLLEGTFISARPTCWGAVERTLKTAPRDHFLPPFTGT